MIESKGSGPLQPPSRAVEDSAPEATTPPTSAAKPSPAVKSSSGEESKPLPAPPARKPEIGGPKGPEPTRYGDWEKGGRCIDF